VKTETSRIDDIEILRAIAVLFTMFDHVPFMLPEKSHVIGTIFRYMTFWSGVDLFFAISGFVIARSLIEKIASVEGREEFWRTSLSFWIRRAYRIWPSSWLWLAIVVLCSAAFASRGTFAPLNVNAQSAAYAFFQVQNFHAWNCVSHAHYSDCFGDVGAWWSLSLEEQFYIALPFAILMFRNRLPYVLAVFATIQILLPRPPLSFLWVVRTDAICLGVLLAVFTQSPLYKRLHPAFLERRTLAVPMVLLLLILLSVVPEDSGKLNLVPLSTGAVAIIAAALVAIASFDRNYIVRNRFLKILLLWVGSRSYSIYLIHFPAVLMMRTLWKVVEPEGTVFGANYSLRYVVAWLAITFVLSEISHRLVELPMRTIGRRVADALTPRVIA
jgi:peptidoglycan/LPS O-acetylase OafA/YrhL